MALDTGGATFHALTVIEGQAEVTCGDEQLILQRFESAVVPAASGRYQLRPITPCRVLKSSVEPM